MRSTIGHNNLTRRVPPLPWKYLIDRTSGALPFIPRAHISFRLMSELSAKLGLRLAPMNTLSTSTGDEGVASASPLSTSVTDTAVVTRTATASLIRRPHRTKSMATLLKLDLFPRLLCSIYLCAGRCPIARFRTLTWMTSQLVSTPSDAPPSRICKFLCFRTATVEFVITLKIACSDRPVSAHRRLFTGKVFYTAFNIVHPEYGPYVIVWNLQVWALVAQAGIGYSGGVSGQYIIRWRRYRPVQYILPTLSA